MNEPVTIKSRIEAALRQARLDKNDRDKQIIGMLRAKLLNELKSGSGAVENDELWLKTLTTYAKELRKTIAAYEEAGERGREALAELLYERDFVDVYLPARLSAEDTRALARQVAAAAGITDPKLAGKLTGLIMKDHRDSVDPDLLKQAVAEALA